MSGTITIESAMAQRLPCWNLHLVRAVYKTILESHAIKASVVESKLIPSVDSWFNPWSKPYWLLSWHSTDIQSASHLTVDWKFWLIQMSQSPMNRLWTDCWSSVNQESTEYWLRCQSSIIEMLIGGIDRRYWLTLHYGCLLGRQVSQAPWKRTVVLCHHPASPIHTPGIQVDKGTVRVYTVSVFPKNTTKNLCQGSVLDRSICSSVP